MNRLVLLFPEFPIHGIFRKLLTIWKFVIFGLGNTIEFLERIRDEE